MKKIILSVLVVFISFGTIQSQDKNIKIGGRIMYDMAAWGENDLSSIGSEFRRVRLYSSGTMYSNVKYKLQLDFAGGKIAFKDVFIELNKLPIRGNVKVGHFKEPLRLEVLTSSKYITFMERGLTASMSRERNSGVMYHTIFGEKLSFQTAVFLAADNFGNNKETTGNINATSRLSYLAINTDNKLLHLGIANSRRKNNNKDYRFSSRAENHLGNKLISVEFINQVEDVNIIAGEIAYVNGALSLQGEALQTTLHSEIGEWNTAVTHELMAYYGQVSYFLTGESKSYKNSLSGFGRVTPKNNYGENGWGAFEIAARVSQMDLSSADSGILNDITLGLNWYLNPNTRVILNYVMGEMTKGTEVITEKSVMMRVQLDF